MEKEKELIYPFDIFAHKKSMIISKKLAKSLIIKFLKRECTFYQMMTECMLYHPWLNNVNDVLDNMVANTPHLYDCLFSSDRIFSWRSAQRYHIGDEDGYWKSLKDKWLNAIGNNYSIQVGYV